MLCTTDNTVTKIAMLCGFGSSNYFKDVFKADVGISRGSTAKNPGCPSTLTCAPTDPKEKREHARRRAPLFRTFYKDSPYLSKMRLKIKALQ